MAKQPVRTLQDIPLSHCKPGPDQVLVVQYEVTESQGGLIIPDRAKIVVQVAQKVGKNVEHVKPGDLVVLRVGAAITGVPELESTCALIKGADIAGVIRGYDWQSHLERPEPDRPVLVS